MISCSQFLLPVNSLASIPEHQSEKGDESLTEGSIAKAKESGTLSHELMEDIAEEDDNIVHILASLESDRSFPLNAEDHHTAGCHAANPSRDGRKGQNSIQDEEGESGDEDFREIVWGYSDFSDRFPKEKSGSSAWGNLPFTSASLSGEEDAIDAEEWEDSDSYNKRSKGSKRRRSWNSMASAPTFTSTVRSFACEKHSKWKKKCPPNCPLRKEHTRVPMARRKLWTKKESALLVRWADDLVQAARETDEMWEDIAKTLNRSVNSTKKKFMRLTNQWSRKPTLSPSTPPPSPPSTPVTPTARSRTAPPRGNEVSGRKEKRKREIDEPWKADSDYDTDMEEYQEHYSEVRSERRATIVCEKHRRWKKRCPADCKDKQEEAEAQLTLQSIGDGKRKTRHRLAGVVGRPAVSCRRHQLEHQKCPEDCPRRRPVPRKEVPIASPPSFPPSPLSPSPSPSSSSSSSPSPIPRDVELAEFLDSCPRRRAVDLSRLVRALRNEDTLSISPSSSPSSPTPRNVYQPSTFNHPIYESGISENITSQNTNPSPFPHARHLSLETPSNFQFRHNLIWKSAAEHGGVGPDYHCYRSRDNTTVSNPGIILDLQDCGLPQVSLPTHISMDRARERRNSSSGFSESELETRRATSHHLPHTSVTVPDPFLSLPSRAPSPTLPLPSPWVSPSSRYSPPAPPFSHPSYPHQNPPLPKRYSNLVQFPFSSLPPYHIW